MSQSLRQTSRRYREGCRTILHCRYIVRILRNTLHLHRLFLDRLLFLQIQAHSTIAHLLGCIARKNSTPIFKYRRNFLNHCSGLNKWSRIELTNWEECYIRVGANERRVFLSQKEAGKRDYKENGKVVHFFKNLSRTQVCILRVNFPFKSMQTLS